MTIKPLKHYHKPKYATYDYFLSHPELLSKVPQRWRGNRLVIAAASVFAMIITNYGCDREVTAGPPTMSPPLTETEAQQIIRDEAARVGINFLPNARTLHNVQVPLHLYPDTTYSDTVRYIPVSEFVFDVYDSTRQIAYEYMSYQDMGILRARDTTLRYRTVSPELTARDLQNALREQYPELHSGVAYEAMNEEYLRMQLDDFIAWLRSQGIL